MSGKLFIPVTATLVFLCATCMSTDTPGTDTRPRKDRKNVRVRTDVAGFGILNRIPGLWNGPVFSDTPAGDYPVWYVDFRPVSASQVSQFSTVDSALCNYITFFIVKHEGRLKVAMRTDARFKGKGCITYEVIREADEERGYYKLADFQSGDRRAFTVFEFGEDEFEMSVFTNKFNTLKEPLLHSRWKAKRRTIEPALKAIEHFGYPQPIMTRDFSATFGNAHESIFFDTEKDPYPSANEPYVGSVDFEITIDEALETSPGDELFLMLTTKPIFNGSIYDPERLNYISRFVYLPIGTGHYTMTHVHPGVYYLYSCNDIDGDKQHKRGDYMSSKWEHIVTVAPDCSAEAHTHIDFIIP